MRILTSVAIVAAAISAAGCQGAVGVAEQPSHTSFTLAALGSAPVSGKADVSTSTKPLAGLQQGKGQLSISVAHMLPALHRQVLATYADVVGVSIALHGPNGESLSQGLTKAQLDTGTSSVSFSNIAPGSWSYEVQVDLGPNQPPVSVSKTAEVVAGEDTTVAVKVPLPNAVVFLPTPAPSATTTPPPSNDAGGGNDQGPSTGNLNVGVSIEDGATVSVMPARLGQSANAGTAPMVIIKQAPPDVHDGVLLVAGHQVRCLDLQGQVVDSWTFDADVFDMAFCMDGSAWVLLYDGRLLHLAPHSKSSTTTATLDLGPLYAAPDGAVWSGATRVAPDRSVQTYQLSGHAVGPFTFDSDGDAFVMDSHGALEKLVPGNLAKLVPLPDVPGASCPTLDVDGYLWVLSVASDGTYNLVKLFQNGTLFGRYPLAKHLGSAPLSLQIEQGYILVGFGSGHVEKHLTAWGTLVGIYMPEYLQKLGPLAYTPYEMVVDQGGHLWVHDDIDTPDAESLSWYDLP